MKRIIGIVLSLLIVAGLLVFFIVFWDSGANGNGPSKTTTPPTTTYPTRVIPDFIEVEEDYYGTVNEEITLEQLQSSKVVTYIQIKNEGSPLATASIFIDMAKIMGINGRTLTLFKDGDELSVYIGENVDIGIVKGSLLREGEFEEVKINGFAVIGARLQYGRGDPLRVYYFDFYEN